MRTRLFGLTALALAAGPAAAQPAGLSPPGAAVEQTRTYLARIERLDRQGPRLNSVLAVNPEALAEARRLDAERRAGRLRGPLHGAPVLIKDNIETRGPLPTTAGSLALTGNVAAADAPLVARLREAGAVILGKANLSEWANFRSTRSISGWSAVGGLVRNPYGLDRTACGSSSGSAAAVAADLAWGAVGTETDGSITCPAAMNGIVGLKPTVGLVSRTGVVPISPEQDTPGPMTRTVAEAAVLLAAMAGSDPADPATAQADARRGDYLAALDAKALHGARLAVWRPNAGRSAETDEVFERALSALRRAGAVLVEVKGPGEARLGAISAAEGAALQAEFRAAIDAYLAKAPAAVAPRGLEALIAFNRAEPRELALFGQEIFEAARKAPALSDPAYLRSRSQIRRESAEALDAMLAEAQAAAIVTPSGAPASVVDPVNGSRWLGSPSTLPAVSGYPHLTVPMGAVRGLPVGLSLLGPAWSEARLLALGYAFEQAAGGRSAPTFPASTGARPEVAAAFDPPRSSGSGKR